MADQMKQEEGNSDEIKKLRSGLDKAKESQKSANNEKNKMNTDLKNLQKKYDSLLSQFDTNQKESTKEIDLQVKNRKLIEEKAKAQADDLSKESTEVKKQKAELKQGEKKLTEDRKVMVEKVKSELQIKFDIHENYQKKLNEVTSQSERLNSEIKSGLTVIKKDRSYIDS